MILESMTFVILLAIQLVILIVFFVMAWNISRMRKIFERSNFKLLLDEAQRLEFQGKNNKAIETYMDCIYRTLKNEDVGIRKERIGRAVKEIEKLGGTIPKKFYSYR